MFATFTPIYTRRRTTRPRRSLWSLTILALFALCGTAQAQNSAPDFGDASVADQDWLTGVALSLVLPAATGGNGALSYSLTPALPAGLTFDADTRAISGTPASTATEAAYTYTVTDSDSNTMSADADTLTFAITVESGTPDRLCTRQGWTHDTASDKCQIPLTSGGRDFDGCFLSGDDDPQCADVFGESLAFPSSALTGVALSLYNAFHREAFRTDNSAGGSAIRANAIAWRDAVVARHNGDPNYAAGPVAALADSSFALSIFLAQQLEIHFKDNGIPFDKDTNDLANEISVAFSKIPVRQPFAFMSSINLRLRIFLEGPLR